MTLLKKDLTSTYIKMALFNLLLVALLGVLMRYKIIFELPLFNQKYAQHSHSHFAFIGWVSHSLFFLIFNLTKSKLNQFQNSDNSFDKQSNYNLAIILNIVLGYAMFLSFLLSGYSVFSIVLSTLSIFCSYYFAFLSFKDLNKIESSEMQKKVNLKDENSPQISNYKNTIRITTTSIKSSLIFMILSSFGTFALAFMNASKIINQELYLSSVYFYLHFQYNGWFFFALFGLIYLFVYDKINNQNFLNSSNHEVTENPNITFKLEPKLIYGLLFTIIPNYLLSILWAKLPDWTYFISLAFGLMQLAFWYYILYNIYLNRKVFVEKFSKMFKLLMIVVLLCIFIKITLQTLVLIPFLAKLAYEYRTIVIAYLHLVLLCIISFGIIAYLYESKLIPNSKSMKIGIYHFIIGVVLNEFILAAQGFASFSYVFLPYINEILFANTILMFVGTLIIFKASLKS